MPLLFLRYLCQMHADFSKSLNFVLTNKLSRMLELNLSLPSAVRRELTSVCEVRYIRRLSCILFHLYVLFYLLLCILGLLHDCILLPFYQHLIKHVMMMMMMMMR